MRFFVPWKIGRSVALFCALLLIFSSVTGCKRIRRLFKKSPAPIEQKQAKAPESAPAQSAPAPLLPPPTPATPLTSPATPESLPAAPAESAPAPTLSGPPPPGPPSTSGDLTVSAGAEKKVAEGSYFQIDDAQALVPAGRRLQYQWSLVQGAADRLQIVKGNVLQGVFKLLNLEEPASFILRLTVIDGANKASSDLSVLGFPAKLVLKNHLGGITRQVKRLGNKTFVARGRTIEIYDTVAPIPKALTGDAFAFVDRIDLENPILELAAFNQQGKDILYALTEAGEWMVLDVTDPKAVGRSLIQKNGALFKGLKVNSSATGTWAVAVEKDKGLVWAITDPAHPEQKLNLQGNYQGLKEMALWGKTLYLVDGSQLYQVDAGAGVLSASVPVGGAAKALEVVEAGGKTSLILGLGEGSAGGAVGDYGLRIFEIGVGGKLVRERRFGLKGNPAVEAIAPIPGGSQLLIGIRQKSGYGLRVFDLGTESEIALETPADFKPAALLDLAAGGPPEAPVAALAEASAFRALKLTPVGNPMTGYKAETVKKSASTLTAARVKMGPGDASVFLSDFGSGLNPSAPALLKINAQDLSLQASLVTGDGSYLPDFILTDRPKINFAANLNDATAAPPESRPVESGPAPSAQSRPAESQAVSAETRPGEGRGTGDGSLRALFFDPKGIRSALSQGRLFGEKKGPNESRVLGLDLRSDAAGLNLAAAVGKTAGVGSRSGLIFLSLPLDADPEILFKGEILSKTSFLPLNDARDVRLSADGKWALVAGGAEGLVLVDLEKKLVGLRMSGPAGSLADRVLLSADQKRVFVSYLHPAEANPASPVPGGPSVSIQIYYFDQGKLGVWGGMKGLTPVTLPYGVRTPGFALSSDDVYFYAASGSQGVFVYNVSDPAQPVLIAKLPTHGQATDIAVGQKYKNLYIADLVNGLEMAEFGF